MATKTTRRALTLSGEQDTTRQHAWPAAHALSSAELLTASACPSSTLQLHARHQHTAHACRWVKPHSQPTLWPAQGVPVQLREPASTRSAPGPSSSAPPGRQAPAAVGGKSTGFTSLTRRTAPGPARRQPVGGRQHHGRRTAAPRQQVHNAGQARALCFPHSWGALPQQRGRERSRGWGPGLVASGWCGPPACQQSRPCPESVPVWGLCAWCSCCSSAGLLLGSGIPASWPAVESMAADLAAVMLSLAVREGQILIGQILITKQESGAPFHPA